MINKLNIILAIVFGLALNISVAFCRKFQDLFITLNVAFCITLLFLLLIKYKFRKFSLPYILFGFFLLQIVGILINQKAWLHLVSETLVVSCIFLFFWVYDKVNILQKLIALTSVYLLVLLLSFYIGPIINYNKNRTVNLSGSLFFSDSLVNSLKLFDKQAKLVNLDSKANKVILIDFWFKGCLPCKLKEESLRKIGDEFKKDSSFLILAVNPGNINSFEEFNTYNFNSNKILSVYDSAGILTNAYKITNFPTSYLLDKKGRIQYKEEGFTKNSDLLYINKTVNEIKKCLSQ